MGKNKKNTEAPITDAPITDTPETPTEDTPTEDTTPEERTYSDKEILEVVAQNQEDNKENPFALTVAKLIRQAISKMD